MSRTARSARSSASSLSGVEGRGRNQKELDEMAWRAARGLRPQAPNTGRPGLFGRREVERKKREAQVDRSRARLARFMEEMGDVRICHK